MLSLMFLCVWVVLCFFVCYGHPRDLHVLTHSFPTLRSSDLSASRSKTVVRSLSVDVSGTGRESIGPVDRQRGPLSSNARVSSNARRSSRVRRSEEHTSELQSLMRISYAVFCLKKKNNVIRHNYFTHYIY